MAVSDINTTDASEQVVQTGGRQAVGHDVIGSCKKVDRPREQQTVRETRESKRAIETRKRETQVDALVIVELLVVDQPLAEARRRELKRLNLIG